MSELLTLSKKDPAFQSFLLGTFAKDRRAIPVESLNVDTDQEQVTFEVKSVSEILRPVWWKMWPQVLKLRNTILVAFPLFLVMIKNVADETAYDPVLAILGALGAFFLQLGVNTRNDYLDHISGLDRVHPQSGSRAIQNGWFAAHEIRKLSWFFLLLGVICGIPCIVVYPETLWFLSLLVFVVFFGILFYRSGLRYRLWTEFAAFLLYGPLLTIAYQVVVAGSFDLESVVMGITQGWFAVFILHLRNFEHILVNTQAGFSNSITKFGFEKAKHFINIWWIGYVFLLNFYHILYGAKVWIWIIAVGSVIVSIGLIEAVVSLRSPVGSDVVRVLEKCRRSAYFLVALWILEGLTYLLVRELG